MNKQVQALLDWKKFCLEEKQSYIDWGSPILNQALLGAQGGDSILIAGLANFGKSQLATSIIVNILKSNEDIVIIDLTLDDSKRKRFTQYIANLSRLEMNAVDYANKLEPHEIERFNIATNKLQEWLENRKLALYENTISYEANGNKVLQNSIEYIETLLPNVKKASPNKKIIVVIDALNNVISKGINLEEYQRIQYISESLERLITENNILLICTSHLRKNSSRRPTLDDLKGNNYLAYTAKVIIGLHSQWKVEGDSSPLVWMDQDKSLRRMPVVEARFLKSKVSDFNGVIFYHHTPSMGLMEEAPDTLQQLYRNTIKGLKD